jgi:hypothetical protein
MHNRGKMFDALLEVHGIGLMAGAGSAVPGAGGTASTPVDLGVGAPKTGGPPEPVGYTEGKLIIDLTAISISNANFGDKFEIWLQGSHDATFTTYHTLFAVKLGASSTFSTMWPNPFVTAASPAWAASAATWPGPVILPLRFSFPFSNDFGGIYYRWLRVFTALMATCATGINYYAFLSI